MADLLIELFSEEIPARMQAKAADDLKAMMTGALKDAGLSFDGADAYATPRRLTLHVTGLATAQPDVKEERRGPRADAPEKAIEGFLRGAGVTRAECEEREDPKGTFLYAVIEKKGRPTAEVIGEALEHTIRNFPWPKSQRWGDGSLRWVRPLHSILCLFDGAVVPVDVDGIKAGNKTFGHRFMAPEWFEVSDLGDYEAKLLAHKVVLDAAERAAIIEKRVRELASEKGLEWVEDRGLLAEVAGLVEWPVPLMGNFNPAFMEVPEEVLILTMKKDQKYFVTRDPKTGKLAPHFITVANMVPSDGGVAVGAGNERVLTARLSDAKFFWEQDLKVKLDDRLPNLEEIVFHIELGKVSDRVERMTKLAGYLAGFIPGCDKAEAERAATLAKADLVSGMVREFPEVQGVMGRYYAQKQGETAAVADAVRDHYAPQGPNDDCPTQPVSVAVALAEKLDTLVGFFGIDQKPTGSKDPYALRRAALGAIRLITENGLRLPIRKIIATHTNQYVDQFAAEADRLEQIEAVEGFVRSFKGGVLSWLRGSEVITYIPATGKPGYQAYLQAVKFENFEANDLLAFFGDRLKVIEREKGVRHDLIDAVFAKGGDDLVDVLNRVNALSAFLKTADGANLLTAYKRAANIVDKSSDQLLDGMYDDNSEPAQKVLFDELGKFGRAALAVLQEEKYEEVMSLLASLRKPIDDFFDNVMVNVEDDHDRRNRLTMLSSFRKAVERVADFSLIEG